MVFNFPYKTFNLIQFSLIFDLYLLYILLCWIRDTIQDYWRTGGYCRETLSLIIIIKVKISSGSVVVLNAIKLKIFLVFKFWCDFTVLNKPTLFLFQYMLGFLTISLLHFPSLSHLPHTGGNMKCSNSNKTWHVLVIRR